MKLRLYMVLCLAWCSLLPVSAQWNVVAVDSVNTNLDEMVCTKYNSGVLFARADKEDYLNNLNWTEEKHYRLYDAKWKDQFTQFVEITPFLESRGDLDDGTAHICQGNMTLWFSTANRVNKSKGNQLQIFSCEHTNDGWGEPKAFRYNSRQYSVAHPCLSPSGDQLFFSSNMPGGAGGMDIWYCNWLDPGWSAPIWMGASVNSPDNEIFPSYFQGEVYYSTDQTGSLDIRKATKESQWKQSMPLEHFNSPADDFNPVFIDHEQGFLTSNRTGNDDIFYFSKDPEESALLNYTAMLMCKGTPIPGAKITVRNEAGMIAFQDQTDGDGSIPLDDLNLYKKYTFNIEGVDPDILEQALLYVLDENGNRIRVYHVGRDGTFVFQALPSDDVDQMTLRDETDESILTLELEGQVYENEPGDLTAGEAVYIMNDQDELLALAFTSSSGQFRFPELAPQMGYRFKVMEGSKARFLTIYEGETEVTVPLENRTAQYQRLDKDNSIRLINENKDPIFIRDDEVFIIRNIYYKFDSANINLIAKQQLDQLGEIMKLNPKIQIEISSHTDSRGEDDYNMDLSDRRAKSAVEQLIALGVQADRMTSIGYGETRLLNNCTNDRECPDELHALNRRTEIRMFVK